MLWVVFCTQHLQMLGAKRIQNKNIFAPFFRCCRRKCFGFVFQVLPPAWQIVGVFLGALPGSWVYGIVFSYMEGRKSTEVLNSIIYLAIIFGGVC